MPQLPQAVNDSGNGEPVWGDDECLASEPAQTKDGVLGNALLVTGSGGLGAMRAYPVNDSASQVRQISFQYRAPHLVARSAKCEELWRLDIGNGYVFGGFDFDSDGWIDIGISRSEAVTNLNGSPVMCQAIAQTRSWIDLVSTRPRNGSPRVYAQVGPKTLDRCNANGTITQEWNHRGITFGEAGSHIALQTYTHQDHRLILSFNGATERFDLVSEYVSATDPNWGLHPASKNVILDPSSTPRKHEAASLFVGLFLDLPGNIRRMVAFSQRRVYQLDTLAVAPELPGLGQRTHLTHDFPFNPGMDPNNEGNQWRSYNSGGLVAVDPRDKTKVVLINGAGPYSTYYDVVRNQRAHDDNAGIERHVARYDMTASNSLTPSSPSYPVKDRFYRSVVGVTDSAEKYEKRITYPANPFVTDPAPGATASLIGVNVFSGGHWKLELLLPDLSLANGVAFANLYLWDVRDVNRDGVEELIMSPTPSGTCSQPIGCYFPSFETRFYHLEKNATGYVLVLDRTFADGIPLLVTSYRDPQRNTSVGYLAPVLTVVADQQLYLMLYGSDRKAKKALIQ